jgi:hypothetical protein
MGFNSAFKGLRTMGPIYRTGAPLPSRCCIFYIFFSTTMSIEYFKHAAHSPFFASKCCLFHNATFFLVPVLFTYYWRKRARHHHHHISVMELGHLLTRSGPEAEGSNPTTGLTLLWARNPFGGNFNHWQVSRARYLYKKSLLLARHVFRNNFCVLGQ